MVSARSVRMRLKGARAALRWAWRRLPRRWRRRACLLVPALAALVVLGPFLGALAVLVGWQGWRLLRWTYERSPEAGWLLVALGIYAAAALLAPGPSWAAMSGTLLLFAALLVHPASRRWLLAHRHLTRQRRTWRDACEVAGIREPEQRTHPQRGRGRVIRPERAEPLLHSAQRTATGVRLRLYLRNGWTATDVERARVGLATYYGARSATLLADPASAAWVTLDLAFRDPLADGTISWPGAPGSLWQPVPVGVDEQGQQATVMLPDHNIFVSGEPGAGKTNAVQLLVAAAALDPTTDVVILDGKEVDFDDWRPVCREFAGAEMREAIEALEGAQRWMAASRERLRGQRRKRVEPGDPLLLVVCDELAYYLGARQKQAEMFTDLLRDLVQRGRALGVIVIAATQRPGSDIVPTSLRDLFGYRLTFRTTTASASDMGLGFGMATLGYDCSTIPASQRGTGYLRAEDALPARLRTYLLPDADLAAVIARALAIREHLPERAAAAPDASPDGPRHGLPTGGCRPSEARERAAATDGWQPGGNGPGSEGADGVGGDGRAHQASQAAPAHADVMAALSEHLNGAPIRQSDLARRVGRKPSDGTVRRALDRLEREGRAVKTPEGWVRG